MTAYSTAFALPQLLATLHPQHWPGILICFPLATIQIEALVVREASTIDKPINSVGIISPVSSSSDIPLGQLLANCMQGSPDITSMILAVVVKNHVLLPALAQYVRHLLLKLDTLDYRLHHLQSGWRRLHLLFGPQTSRSFLLPQKNQKNSPTKPQFLIAAIRRAWNSGQDRVTLSGSFTMSLISFHVNREDSPGKCLIKYGHRTGRAADPSGASLSCAATCLASSSASLTGMSQLAMPEEVRLMYLQHSRYRRSSVRR
eukprot:g37412.t1